MQEECSFSPKGVSKVKQQKQVERELKAKQEQDEVKAAKKAMKMEVPVLNLLKGQGIAGHPDDRAISSISKRNSTGMAAESMFSNELKSHRSNN